jgi:hypothetical protein
MCWSRLISRSKRRSLIELTLLPLLFVRPYRCMECDWRFFRCSVLNKATHKRHSSRHRHAH